MTDLKQKKNSLKVENNFRIISVALGKTEKKKVAEGEAPRFVIPLQDMRVYVGTSIDLECKVVGNPPPQVKW